MLRYQVFLSYGFLLLAIWYKGLESRETLTEVVGIPDVAITFLPLWVLVMLAFYALFVILAGVVGMTDNSDATKEMESEIIEAKAAMKKKGVPVVG
mmetsp:Transcript_27101/g.39680  ORF Transcript_27101/g.39680 Transcript_27101/m.39680 type:complete len:96 (+) Transcript_27101:159-446(+)|eukprot:CAMPEP_0194032866 /NCGR_PEP_ID=MMETSP0009_2-20130614/5717_1 /TAXON_ID=210454 /ORGANISM="Grammatophora oceanica, Strain CCMP 410" /LENGTH=95 /DNA_ID=CAMNT_0038673431 /DNA_START=143 /DNA_END=430 /DNA_ORIENTATION=-